MLKFLRSVGLIVKPFDTGPGEAGEPTRLHKHWKVFTALLSDSAPSFYSAVNDNKGMLLTVILCAAARISGKSIMLHHHSGRYVKTRKTMLSLLVKASGPDALHLVQGERIAQRMRALYSIRHIQPFSNVGLVKPQISAPNRSSRMSLGQLSNLSEAKGIREAIDTLRLCLNNGRDVELILAGPCSDSVATSLLASAKSEFGERFTYMGPLYGEEKNRFFELIDVFLFPSQYAPETQGIVNLEALSYGKPVIGFENPCLPHDLGSDGGLIVKTNEPFAERTLDYVSNFSRTESQKLAKRQFDKLKLEHETQVRRLLAWHGFQTGQQRSASPSDPKR